jgi:hypothetical protein
LNSARTEQEKRLPGLSSRSAKPIYEDIARSAEEIKSLNSRIEELSTQLLNSNDSIVELKAEKKEIGDIGTLQFIADSFNTSIEKIVKWFTLAIVLVFDPLAVSLVLAYSSIMTTPSSSASIRNKLKTLPEPVQETPTPVVENVDQVKHRSETKYRG